MLTNSLLALLSKIAPDVGLRLNSARDRWYIERNTARDGLADQARTCMAATGGAVFSGPFKGLKIDYDLLPVHAAPSFIGTYEREIHGFVERCIAAAPERVLVIGSSFGYYTVGLARRLPNAMIDFAEADGKSIRATIGNGAVNGVGEQLRSIGIVHQGEFSGHLGGKSGQLIVADCEGAEFALLDPVADPILAETNILVEIHPEHGSSKDLTRRFAATHDVEVVAAAPRTIADMPEALRGALPVEALDERRDEDQEWAYLQVRGMTRP